MTEPYRVEYLSRYNSYLISHKGNPVTTFFDRNEAHLFLRGLNYAYAQGVADTLAKIEERRNKREEL